jgi:lipooligosaccharide transport system ATP-binding protein
MPIVQARSLVKQYGSLTAVNDVSFSVEAGECFGFLGPNGAGKTTVMKMITCTSPPSSGELEVDGLGVHADARRIKSILGVVPQEVNLDEDLNVLQNLLVYARYFGMANGLARQRALEALESFELMDKRSSRIEQLSGGMKRRLMLARAMLHQPKIVVLDEPTTGLDPHARQMLWQNLAYLKAQGTTLLLTTHYMEEATQLCDRLVIMHMGEILVEGRPSHLIEQNVGERVAEVRMGIRGRSDVISLLRTSGVAFQDLGDRVVIFGNNQHLPEGLTSLNGVEVLRRRATLEDVFLHLTGQGLEEP